MVYVVKEKPSKEELDKIFRLTQSKRKGVNVRKYAGKIKTTGNPVLIQRKLRDEEWS